MISTLPLPLSLAERNDAPEILRAEATFEEYLEFAEVCEYNVDFFDNQLISMGQASLPHELLVARLITIFSNAVENNDDYQVYGSNIKVHIPACVASFNADVTVIKGEPDYLLLASGKRSTTEIQNPAVIVEILSKTTYNYDLGTKLSCYKTLPSLKQVIFIDQDKVSVQSYTRTDDPHTWINHDLDSLAMSLPVLDFEVSLQHIYKKIKF
ncbi:MAG: Uma2 family endonuclease [Spirosomataceae bacterium]